MQDPTYREPIIPGDLSELRHGAYAANYSRRAQWHGSKNPGSGRQPKEHVTTAAERTMRTCIASPYRRAG